MKRMQWYFQVISFVRWSTASQKCYPAIQVLVCT